MTKYLNISTDTTLGGNSPADDVVVSQKAIKTYVDNQGGGGTTYTAGTGIDITSNTISVTAPTLTNTATGTNALTILGTASTKTSAFNIGVNTESILGGTAVGTGAKVTGGNDSWNYGGVAVGTFAGVSSGKGVAIGYGAKVTAKGAIQISTNSNYNQTNSGADTFKVANQNGNYEIMSADGTIPTDRFTTTPSADGTYVPTLTIASGVATRSWGSGGGGGDIDCGTMS